MAEEKKEKLEKSKEGLGISAFTLGVLGIIFSGWMGITVCAAGLVFGLLQQKRHKTGMGKVAVILNIIGIVLGIIVVIIYSQLSPYLSQLPA